MTKCSRCANEPQAQAQMQAWGEIEIGGREGLEGARYTYLDPARDLHRVLDFPVVHTVVDAMLQRGAESKVLYLLWYRQLHSSDTAANRTSHNRFREGAPTHGAMAACIAAAVK